MRKGNVCLIGDGAVGKSSILARLMRLETRTTYDPTIEDSFEVEEISPSGEVTILNFIDTSGQGEYVGMVNVSIAIADIILVVYDISRPKTFKRVKYLVNHAYEQKPKPSVLLVCNKQDLDREHKLPRDVVLLANSRNIELFLTSAVEGTGITELRNRIIELSPEAVRETTTCCCCFTH